MIEKGIKGIGSVQVTSDNTAAAMGSGALDVFATPALVALIENTAMRSIRSFLEEGQTTVGTLVNVKHIAATPVGMTVRCETELIEVDRRRLVFKAECYDDSGLVGEGVHERFVVDAAKFMSKANAKSSPVAE